jgi:hypothetical protein
MSIGFLFLTLGDLHPIWDKWFPHLKYVYVHNKYQLKNPEFAAKCIKTIETRWGHISLVEAMLLLLKESFKDNYITHFVFLSGNCVPLYDYIYTSSEIVKLEKSTFHFFPSKDFKNVHSDLVKSALRHSQWCILKRNDAEMLINNDYMQYFRNVSIPDEIYFATVLRFADIQIDNKMTTYVDWHKYVKRNNGKSPHHFKILNEHTLSYIYSNYPTCLFMRKVDHCVGVYPYRRIYKEIKLGNSLGENMHFLKFKP